MELYKKNYFAYIFASFFIFLSVDKLSAQDSFLFECDLTGNGMEAVLVGGGDLEPDVTSCLSLADYDIDPQEVDSIQLYYYFDTDVANNIPNEVTFSSAAGATAIGVLGDYFYVATLPTDGSNELCINVDGPTTNASSFFGMILTSPEGSTGGFSGITAIDNEVLRDENGDTECIQGAVPMVVGNVGETKELIFDIAFSEMEQNDPRVLTVYFEACGVIYSDTVDIEPDLALGDDFAIVTFTLENVPADCGTMLYEFCSPDDTSPAGQSFAIAGIVINSQCVDCTIPTASPASLTVCHDGNNMGMFNLSDMDAIVFGGQTGLTATYHETSTNADAGTAALSSPYTSTATSLYVRLETAEGCYTIGIVDLLLEDCPDGSLTKSADTGTVGIGETVSYTLTFDNEGNVDLNNVMITDILPAGLTYDSHTPNASNYDSATGLWQVGTVSVGTMETLTITAVVDDNFVGGVLNNIAEVTAMDETDVDSTPDNTDPTEDDLSEACISVPIELCEGQGESITLEAAPTVTDVVWFDENNTQIGTGAQIIVADAGTYYYTATDANGCSGEMCCPIIVTVVNCCPPVQCIPISVSKVEE